MCTNTTRQQKKTIGLDEIQKGKKKNTPNGCVYRERERESTFLEEWGIFLGGGAVGVWAAEDQCRVAPKPPDFTLLYR